MTTEEPSPSGRPASPFASRLLPCAVAIIALAGACWASFGTADCGRCQRAAATFEKIPLAWVGVGFYAILAVVAGRFGLSRLTRAGFFVAAGVHLVLLALLAWQKSFCGPCILTGAAAFAGAILCLGVRPRSLTCTLVPFGVAALATLATVAVLQARRPIHVYQHPVVGLPTATSEADRVSLVVYERDGCKHCVDFEERVLPQVNEALGKPISVERRDADLMMTTPTIVVQGKGGATREFVGDTEANDLLDAIHALQ